LAAIFAHERRFEMFDAQLRADIETIDVTINNYERLANAPQAWERIKKSLEGVQKQYGKAPSQQLKAAIALVRTTALSGYLEKPDELTIDSLLTIIEQRAAV
jgi:hypothetical protein